MSDQKINNQVDQEPASSLGNSPVTTTATSNSENSNKKDVSFVERWENHRFWLVRASYTFLYSVWVVVMAVGGFIAWLVAMLFV